MSDLISKSKLIEQLKECLDDTDIQKSLEFFGVYDIIESQEIAYDVEKVVRQIEKQIEQYKDLKKLKDRDYLRYSYQIKALEDAIEIVKQSSIGTDDVCEYKITDNMVHAGCNNKQIASAFCWLNECDYYKYCPHCGKKIKVVE